MRASDYVRRKQVGEEVPIRGKDSVFAVLEDSLPGEQIKTNRGSAIGVTMLLLQTNKMQVHYIDNDKSVFRKIVLPIRFLLQLLIDDHNKRAIINNALGNYSPNPRMYRLNKRLTRDKK